MVKTGETLNVIFAFTLPGIYVDQGLCNLLRMRAKRPVAFRLKFHFLTGRLEEKPSTNSLICPAFARVTEVTPLAGSKDGFSMMRLLEKLKPVWIDMNLLPLKNRFCQVKL